MSNKGLSSLFLSDRTTKSSMKNCEYFYIFKPSCIFGSVPLWKTCTQSKHEKQMPCCSWHYISVCIRLLLCVLWLRLHWAWSSIFLFLQVCQCHVIPSLCKTSVFCLFYPFLLCNILLCQIFSFSLTLHLIMFVVYTEVHVWILTVSKSLKMFFTACVYYVHTSTFYIL